MAKQGHAFWIVDYVWILREHLIQQQNENTIKWNVIIPLTFSTFRYTGHIRIPSVASWNNQNC